MRVVVAAACPAIMLAVNGNYPVANSIVAYSGERVSSWTCNRAPDPVGPLWQQLPWPRCSIGEQDDVVATDADLTVQRLQAGNDVLLFVLGRNGTTVGNAFPPERAASEDGNVEGRG